LLNKEKFLYNIYRKEVDMDSIAERVDALRREKGWSKVELARRSQLHQQHIYKVLAGERKHISVDTVIALARAFGVSTDYLLGLQAGHGAAPVPQQRIGTVRNVTHEYAHLETFAAPRPSPRTTTPVT
jgi:transcriptional regulator with XRE-family HTH domain